MGADNHQGKKQESLHKSSHGMERNLGFVSVFAVCTGAMFSSGFFLLPGLAAADAGPSLPVVYLTASLLILPAVFCISELSSAMPRSGGPYVFINRSLGPLFGIIGAFGKYMQLLLKGAFAFVGVGAYLSLVINVSIEPVAICLIIGFTFLNLVGVQQTALTEKILVAILLVLLSYFTVAGLWHIAETSTEIQDRFTPFLPFNLHGFFNALALVSISYAGIGQVASISEEIKAPSKNIPKGMLAALGVATFFYLSGTFIMVATINALNLHGDQAPVATAVERFSSLPLPVLVIVIASFAAFASTGNAAILSAARYPLSLARDGLIWSRFGKVDDKGIPKASVILTGILLIAIVLILNVERIAKFASAFLLFVFFAMCVSVIILRESRVAEYKPGYRSPLYPWMQIAGIVIYVALIIGSGVKAIFFIAAICGIGGLWYYFGVRNQINSTAAIFRLFARLGTSATTNTGGIELPVLSDASFTRLAQRAILLDLKEEDYKDVIKQAAKALADHLGGNRKIHAKRMEEDVRRWMITGKAHVAVAPALLEGIEQPEMIIVRGKIHLHKETFNGLIVLVDDERSSGRLLKLLTKLNQVIHQTKFPKVWQDAENEDELRSALLHQDVHAITLHVDQSGPTANMEGKNVHDAPLPEGSLIAIIAREGNLMVPQADTKLQNGDDITIFAESEIIKELTDKYNTEH